MREQERESSVASSADFYGTDSPPRAVTDAPDTATAVKRKAENAHGAQPKKLKVASSWSSSSSSSSISLQSCKKLPPPVWQHIFLYCSLADLGRLMQVNRSFLSYLRDVSHVSTSQSDATAAAAAAASSSSSLRLLKSDSLWASARNALSHKPPKPLPGFTELQMWQLALGRTCQFCKKSSTYVPGEKLWQKGPGATGVRVIWPFGIRACGECLLLQCHTDASVLFSSASALRPALPFAFITDDYHYVAAYTLQSAVTPAQIQISKYYLKRHVDDITQELEHALSLGVSAAEEWSKGLEIRGKERMRHAENWERWEVRYQWHESHQDSKRTTSTATSLVATPQRNPSTSPTQKSRSPSVYNSIPTTSGLDNLHRPPTVPPQVFAPYPIRTGSAALQKNLHDANEAKTNRRTDIEHRCLQMDPPIPPNVLRHMDSFKAAIQISQPMNEHAWSVLQPRLVAQLDAAQQAEADHVSRQAQQSTKPADRRHPDLSTKEAREVMDRDWEESQRWVRDQLNSIADDFIDKEWNGSKAINYENSPKFAADLLSHARRQFYTQLAANPDIVSENPEAKTKLVLDDMKWLYDSKIKPLTEQFRKEMFLCSINDCDRNMKFYGFEGIIQHFGARHTNAFSVDKVIVAWREAEWPEATPFHADPASVRLNYGGYRPDTTTPRIHRHAFAQPSPGPHPSGPYPGPFPPPHIGTPSQTMPGIAYPPPYITQDSTFPFQPIGPPGFGAHTGHLPYITSPAVINTALASPPSMSAHTQSLLGNVTNGTDDGHSTSSFDMQVSTVIRMARDLWKQTSGVKDMPNSLRIYVLIHRVISKFHVEFNHEPTLDHFNDAFTNHDIPPALKNAPGLSCKACQLEVSRQSAGGYFPKPEERRTYTLSNLLAHFKAQHLSSQRYDPITGQPVANLDWKEDMIELPSERFISGLIHAPGMDDEKLLIIATVFPKYFPMPLPRMGAGHGQSKASSPNAMSLPDAQSSSDLPVQPPKAAQDPGSDLPQPVPVESPLPRRPIVEEYDPLKPALTKEGPDPETNKLTQHDLIPSERRQRFHAEPRYYVGSLYDSNGCRVAANHLHHQMSMEQVDDGYPRHKEYIEYAGPALEQYPGRRTAFRESERYLDLPPEEVPYSHQHDGPYARNHRQVRYFQEEEHPDYRYVRRTPSREASPTQAQTDADRFLDEFVPNSSVAGEPSKPGSAPMAPSDAIDDVAKPSSIVPVMPEADTQPRSLHAPFPKAPSTVSNGSRYDDYEHSRQVPSPDMPGPSRRPGPQRRRDRHHEYRMPSRFYRYMSAAREDPMMRGSSMSRSQRGRYEEQRRRIHQQETPQPRLEREYEPAYSRDQSVDHVGGEDKIYQPRARDYVSVQDRLHPYSPPRYRDYEHRGPQPLYVDEYGPPVHEYEIIRVPRDPRQSRAVYHQPARYGSEQFQYVPMPYERSPPQRYESRPSEYVYYEERERDRSRPLPRRPIAGPGAPRQETDRAFESVPPPDIKVENVTPNNAGGPPPPPPDVV